MESKERFYGCKSILDVRDKNQSVVIVEQLGLATNQGSHEDTEWKNHMCEKRE